jgi:hypothetical protein
LSELKFFKISQENTFFSKLSQKGKNKKHRREKKKQEKGKIFKNAD